MRLPFTHPSMSDLERFAEGAPNGAARRRTATHLQRCSSCRDTVQLIRELSQQRHPGSEPGPSLLKRILASRASGHRVLLPVADGDGRTHVRRFSRFVAAAALVTGLGLLAVLGTRDAVAGSWTGELQLNPAAPTTGATVSVVYRPPQELAGEQVLRLRARFRAAGDGTYWFIPVRTAALLQRQGDGTFTGAFVLPDSVVYGALAVEDTAARRVDNNDGRSWELLTHGVDGRPMLAALEQRVDALIGLDFEGAHATVVRMTQLYPGRYSTWDRRRHFARWLHPESADSARAVYADTVAQLEIRMRASSAVPVADLEDITRHTFFEDTASHAYWRERLLKADPRNQRIQELTTVELALMYRSNPARLLSALDSLWEAIGPAWGAGRLMVVQALHAAAEAQDYDALRLWADRLRDMDRTAEDPTIRIFLTHSALRREGMTRLRAELGRLAVPPEGHRRLGETRERFYLRLDATRRRMFADLGTALLAEGELRAGLDTLAIAVEKGWNWALFRRAGDARLSVGDTLGALRMYALVLADPRSTAATGDSLHSIARRHIGADEWNLFLREADTELPLRMLEGAEPRPLRGKASVADRDGRRHSVSDLVGGEVSLVVFWSRFCGPAIAELPVVDSIAARLRERGVRVVSITDEVPSAALDSFIREKGLTMPVFYDTRGEAMSAFSNVGKPAYYVLDSSARIRFRYANPVDDLLMQAEALLRK